MKKILVPQKVLKVEFCSTVGNYSKIDVFLMEREMGQEFEYLYKQYTNNLYYSTIVNDIITFEYPNDKMQAIVNNYLLDPSDEKALEEFNKMQDFRKLAKKEAKACIEYYNELINEKKETN